MGIGERPCLSGFGINNGMEGGCHSLPSVPIESLKTQYQIMKKRVIKEERVKREKEHDEMLEGQKRMFLAGERIQPEHFLELAKSDGFEIHIRTRGTFVKSVRMFDKWGTIHYVKTKGQKKPDFTGCHKTIEGYLKFLMAERIKQRLTECGVSSDLWKQVSDRHKGCIVSAGLHMKPLSSEQCSILNEVVCNLADLVLVRKHGIDMILFL